MNGKTDPTKSRPAIKEADSSRISSYLWLVYIPTFLLSVGWGMVLPIIPLFAKNLGAGLGLTGLIVAMKGIGTLILDLPAGLLITSLGKRKIILITSGGACIVALLTGLVGSILWFGVLTIMLGGLHSMWMMAQMAVLRDAAQAHQRGRAIAVLGGVSRSGTFVGPIVGGFLGKFLGFQAAYFGQAVVSFAALIFLYHYSRQLAWEPMRRIGTNPLTRIGHIVIHYRHSFITAGPAVLAVQLLRAAKQIIFPLWGDSIGLDVAAIGIVMGLSSAVDMTLFYPAGWIMDHWGRKKAAIPALLLFSLSMALIPLTNSFATLMLVGFLAGLGNGLSSGLVMTIGSDLAPDRGTGDFLGVWRLIGDIGTASGPFIIGMVAQAFTLGLAPWVTACIGVGGASAFLFLVKETLNKQTVPPPEIDPSGKDSDRKDPA